MQDSKSKSVHGNPFTETGIQWLSFFVFLFFFKFFFSFFFVGIVVRYNTALARFRDNPENGGENRTTDLTIYPR